MTKISYMLKILIIITYLLCTKDISYAGFLSLPDYYAEACIAPTNLVSSITLKRIDVKYLIKADETVFVKTYYELYNTSDDNLTQEICLPFFSQPLSMTFLINSNVETPQWKLKNVPYYIGPSSVNIVSMKMISIIKNITFQPKETKKIELSYDRKIVSKKNNYEQICDVFYKQASNSTIPRDYFYKCVYIARTGYMWKNAINNAKISFVIHKSLINKDKFFTNITRGNDYKPGYMGKTHYTCDESVLRVEDNDYITLTFNYDNWLPEFDLGVNWIVPLEEKSIIYYIFKNYWQYLFTLFIIFLIILVNVKNSSKQCNTKILPENKTQ